MRNIADGATAPGSGGVPGTGDAPPTRHRTPRSTGTAQRLTTPAAPVSPVVVPVFTASAGTDRAPVFVDAAGRRGRRSVWAALVVAALCVAFMALVLLSLTGDRVGPNLPPGAYEDRPADVIAPGGR